MSNYSYDDTPVKQKSRLNTWDLMSIIALLITICAGAYFVMIFVTPNSPFNPLIPQAIMNAGPTATITPIQLEPTWTATLVEQTPTLTPTLLPTFTLEPSATPISLVPPTRTPSPTKTPKAPFSVTVSYIDSTIIHPEAACNWQGVGGTVVDANNADMLRMTIRLEGFYNGKSKNELTVSSIAPSYGVSGFEFYLGDKPLNSKSELAIQLLDQAGLPLSDQIFINTSEDCSKNLVLVRFKKNAQ